MTLPSQRTLRDYTYYVRTTTGFSTEGDRQMMTAAKLEEGSTNDREKCVVMVMDEMYVKEDLVYIINILERWSALPTLVIPMSTLSNSNKP